MASREPAFSPDSYGEGFHFRPDDIVRCFISRRRREVELSPLMRRAGSVSSVASVASFGQISIERVDLLSSSPKGNRWAKADIAAAYGFHPGSNMLRRKLSDAAVFPEDDQATGAHSDKDTRSQTLPGRLSPSVLVDDAFEEPEQAADSRKGHQRKASVGAFLKDTLKRKRGKQEEKQSAVQSGEEGQGVDQTRTAVGTDSGRISHPTPRGQTTAPEARGGRKSPRSPSTPVAGDERPTSFLGRLSSLLNRSTSRDGVVGEPYDTLKKKRKPKKKKRKKRKGSDEEDEDGFAEASAGARNDRTERARFSADVEFSTDDALDASSSGDEIVADSASVDVLADSLGCSHQCAKGHDARSQQHKSKTAFIQQLPLMSVSNEAAVDVCADSGLGGEGGGVAASDGGTNGQATPRQETFEEALTKTIDVLDDFALRLENQYGDCIDGAVKSLVKNPNIATYQEFSDSALQLLAMISESTNMENSGLSDRYIMALMLHFTARLVSSLPSHLKDLAVIIESHGIRLLNNCFYDFFTKGPGIAWSFIRRSFRGQRHGMSTPVPPVDMSLVSSPRQDTSLNRSENEERNGCG